MLPFIILITLGGVYGASYYLNSKVPVPEGAQSKLENCKGCSISSCELHPVHRNMEE